MNFLQPLSFDVRINLGRGNIGMTEHGLHRSKIRSTFQQVCRERMSQNVGGNLFDDASASSALTKRFPKPLPGEWSAAARDEHEA